MEGGYNIEKEHIRFDITYTAAPVTSRIGDGSIYSRGPSEEQGQAVGDEKQLGKTAGRTEMESKEK